MANKRIFDLFIFLPNLHRLFDFITTPLVETAVKTPFTRDADFKIILLSFSGSRTGVAIAAKVAVLKNCNLFI